MQNAAAPATQKRRRRLLILAASATFTLGAVAARGATFTGGMLTLMDATTTGSGPANPYPSTVNVSGLSSLAATGSPVTLTINNFSRPSGRAGDIDMLLVGPTGGSLIFWSDVGTNAATAVNVSITPPGSPNRPPGQALPRASARTSSPCADAAPFSPAEPGPPPLPFPVCPTNPTNASRPHP